MPLTGEEVWKLYTEPFECEIVKKDNDIKKDTRIVLEILNTGVYFHYFPHAKKTLLFARGEYTTILVAFEKWLSDEPVEKITFKDAFGKVGCTFEFDDEHTHLQGKWLEDCKAIKIPKESVIEMKKFVYDKSDSSNWLQNIDKKIKQDVKQTKNEKEINQKR